MRKFLPRIRGPAVLFLTLVLTFCTSILAKAGTGENQIVVTDAIMFQGADEQPGEVAKPQAIIPAAREADYHAASHEVGKSTIASISVTNPTSVEETARPSKCFC